jgi:hypothetical protein
MMTQLKEQIMETSDIKDTMPEADLIVIATNWDHVELLDDGSVRLGSVRRFLSDADLEYLENLQNID